ncbi:hypothetical protein [uncultured Methanobrevibacter sp.]|uniref:hypothetical protein n=1 Tax=uncultured Methanobrevibacter sp. TaxID=253161 RepID=UPI0025EEA977|nr:hypothetical protein [uncultured Methanobrevibacter sp.]
MKVNNTIFSLNKVSSSNLNRIGGAIYSADNVYVFNSTFEENHADKSAGAIYCEKSLYINVPQSENGQAYKTVFTNNKAASYGGAIYVKGDTKISDCIFDGQKLSNSDGGAIYVEFGSIEIKKVNI